MKKIFALGMLALALILMMGCAAGPNESANSPDEEGKVAGFCQGLWHGIMAPITFVISLFSDNVHFYEVHNNRNWYNFGFLLGLGILTGGGGRASSR